jgi:hypothetical protein
MVVVVNPPEVISVTVQRDLGPRLVKKLLRLAEIVEAAE